MIAANTDPGADLGGELGANMFTECCDFSADGEEECEFYTKQLFFPKRSCQFLGIGFNMPTCWNGELDSNNHKDHMAYTVDGTVAGACPVGFDRRLPHLQVFVRIMNYKGDKYRYTLSDRKDDAWHVDFFGGWEEGKLEEIIAGCPPHTTTRSTGFNPPCRCTEDFLTPNKKVARTMCDDDVRKLMIDEATDVTGPLLPRGTCQGPALIERSWNKLKPGLYGCNNGGSCKEYKKDKFFKKEGKQANCKWLGKQKKRKRKRLCKKGGQGGYEAQIVCPATCEKCD